MIIDRQHTVLFLRSIAILSLLVFFLAGCGQDAQTTPSASPATSFTPTISPTPSLSPSAIASNASSVPSLSPSALPISFDHYHSLAEYETSINALAAQPLSLGLRQIGSSFEGKPIWALGIGSSTPEKEVLIVGLTHGCEWLGGELALDLANTLLNPPPEGMEAITQALAQTAVWIVPVLNPDGYVQSGEGDLEQANAWRKNARLLGDPPFDPARDGADLNRNFSYRWTDSQDGAVVAMGDRYFPGTAPFSEPETQALRDFVAQHQFTLSIALHSSGDQLYFPWGFTEEPVLGDFDTFNSLAQGIADRSGVEVSFEFPLGYTQGNSDDYLYGEFGTYAYTMDIWNEHFPAEELLPSILAEKLPGLMYAIQEAANLPPPKIQLPSPSSSGISPTPQPSQTPFAIPTPSQTPSDTPSPSQTPSDTPPAMTPSMVQLLVGGTRADKDGWIELRIQGTPYQRGFQHGFLLAEEIRQAIQTHDHLIRHDTGKDFAYFAEKAMEIFDPMLEAEYREEMAGIADGASQAGVPITFQEILGWNSYIELVGSWWSASIGQPMVADRCSAFIATGSRVKSFNKVTELRIVASPKMSLNEGTVSWMVGSAKMVGRSSLGKHRRVGRSKHRCFASIGLG